MCWALFYLAGDDGRDGGELPKERVKPVIIVELMVISEIVSE